MGLVQKETKGRADPVLVRAILQDKTSWPNCTHLIIVDWIHNGMCKRKAVKSESFEANVQFGTWASVPLWSLCWDSVVTDFAMLEEWKRATWELALEQSFGTASKKVP